MNLKFTFTFIIIFSFTYSYSQFSDSVVLYNQNSLVDTFVKPDYFEVEISYSEYTKAEKSGRKWEYKRVLIDTIHQFVLSILSQYNIIDQPYISSITNKSRDIYRYNNIMFQQTLVLKIDSREKVLKIFDELKLKLNVESFSGFKSFPKLNQDHNDSVVLILNENALDRLNVSIKKYASKNGLKLIRSKNINSNSTIGPSIINNNLDNNYLPYTFNLNLSLIKISVNVYSTFELVSK